jgi:hypothetical protein
MNHPNSPPPRRPVDVATDEASSDHPVGTGVGVAGGAAAGAAVGMAGGPVGAAIGAVVGAIAGGLAGNTIAQAIHPEVEDAYWREAHNREPYYSDNYSYDDYAPAYRAGYESRMQGHTDWSYTKKEWERRWDAEHAQSRLDWSAAEPAIHAAWERANRAYVQESGS